LDQKKHRMQKKNTNKKKSVGVLENENEGTKKL